MKKGCAVVAALVLACSLAEARAADFSAAVGQTGESTMTYRVSAQWNFASRWFESLVGSLSGYWDAG